MTDYTDPDIIYWWYAVPNEDSHRGGWMPVYDHKGKQWGEISGKGYALTTALKMAKSAAEDAAAYDPGEVVVAQKPGTLKRGRPRKKQTTRQPQPRRARVQVIKKSPAQLQRESNESLMSRRR